MLGPASRMLFHIPILIQERPAEDRIGRKMSRRKQANPKPIKGDEDRADLSKGYKTDLTMKTEITPQPIGGDADDEDRPLVIDTSCDQSNEDATHGVEHSPQHSITADENYNQMDSHKSAQIPTSIKTSSLVNTDIHTECPKYESSSPSSRFQSYFEKEGSGGSTPQNNGTPTSPHSSLGSAPPSPQRPVPGRRSKKTPVSQPPVTAAKPSVNSDKNFQCPICPEMLTNSHDLTKHIRSHNSVVTGTTNNNMCTICGKVLSSQSSLDRHMLVHSGERPFKCKICKMAFTTNGNMHRHMRIHGKDGEGSADDFRIGPGRKPRGNKTFSPRQDLSVPSMVGFRPIHVPMMTNSFQDIFPKRKPSYLPGYGEKRPHDDMDDNALEMPAKRRMSYSAEIESNSPSSKGSMHEDQADDSEGFEIDQQNMMNGDSDVLQCPICSKSFLCKKGFETHVASHTGPGLHCMICNLFFHTERGLQLHQLKAHPQDEETKEKDEESGNEDDPMTDEKNGTETNEERPAGFQDLDFMEFSNNKFILAAKAHCEKNPRVANSSYHEFSCKDCEKSFPCQSALNLHQCSHTPEKLASCPICQCHFDDSQKLHVHMIKHLSDKPLADCQPQLDLSSIKGQDGPMKHNFLAYLNLKSTDDLEEPGESISSLCGDEKQQNNDYFAKLGQAYSALLEKQKAALFKEKMASQVLSEMMKSSGLTANGLQLPTKPMMLEPTPTVSTEGSRLLAGLMHAQLDVYSVPASLLTSSPVTDEDSGSGGVGETTQHERSKGMFYCKYCEKGFTNSRALKGHTRTHLGLSPYKCNLCPYSSADKSTLIRHLRTHNGERPFQCLVCEFAFTTKANCERHVRKKHEKLNKEEIEKSIGYNKFVSADSAKKLDSTNFHSPDTVCKYCGVDFKFFRALKHHLRSHSSCRQKPFLCQKCRIGFSTKANCVRHIQKQHLDVNPNLIEQFIQVNEPAMYSLPVDNDPLSDNSLEASYASVSYSPNLTAGHHSHTPSSLQNGLVSLSPRPAHSTPVRSNAAALGLLSQPQNIKLEPGQLKDDLPLDFSMKPDSLKPPPSHKPILPPLTQSNDSHDMPMDLSIKKDSLPEKASKSLNNSSIALPSQLMACQSCPMKFTSRGALDRHQRLKHQTPMSFTSRPNRSAHIRSATLSSPSVNVSSGSDCELASIHKMMDITNPHKFQAFFQTPDFDSTMTSTPFRGVGNMLLEKQMKSAQHLEENLNEADFENKIEKVSPSDSFDENYNMKRSSDGQAVYSGEITPTSHRQFAFNEEDYSNQSFDNEMDSNTETKEESSEMCAMDGSMEATHTDGDGIQQKKKRNSYADSPHKLHCPYCPRTFPWVSSLTRHLLTHTGQKPYKCPRCPVTFSTKSNRERHLIRKHNVNMLDPASRQTMDRPYKCHLCIFSSFATKSNLMKHYQERHPDSEIPETILRGEFNPEGQDPDEGQMMDPMDMASDQELEEVAKLEEEELARIELVREAEFEKIVRPTSKRPLNPERDNYNVDKITECWKCQAKFMSRKLLVRHLKEHNIDFPFKCYLCDASFESRKECLHHQEEMHPDDWPHLQEKNKVDNIETFSLAMEDLVAKNYKGCDPDTVDFSELVAGEEGQIDAATSDYIQRKVYCSLCPKRFWSLQDLRRHMRSHTGEKPFECDLCQKRFTLKHSMMRHRKKHLDMPEALSASDDEDAMNISDLGPKVPDRKNLVIESVLNRIRANQEAGLKPTDLSQEAYQSKTTSYRQCRKSPVSGLSSLGGSSRDILQSLLGVEDSAIDEMLESADSAAERLGVK